MERGKVALFGEGMVLSSWKVRRLELEFLEPWKKFKGDECMVWRIASQ